MPPHSTRSSTRVKPCKRPHQIALTTCSLSLPTHATFCENSESQSPCVVNALLVVSTSQNEQVSNGQEDMNKLFIRERRKRARTEKRSEIARKKQERVERMRERERASEEKQRGRARLREEREAERWAQHSTIDGPRLFPSRSSEKQVALEEKRQQLAKMRKEVAERKEASQKMKSESEMRKKALETRRQQNNIDGGGSIRSEEMKLKIEKKRQQNNSEEACAWVEEMKKGRGGCENGERVKAVGESNGVGDDKEEVDDFVSSILEGRYQSPSNPPRMGRRSTKPVLQNLNYLDTHCGNPIAGDTASLPTSGISKPFRIRADKPSPPAFLHKVDTHEPPLSDNDFSFGDTEPDDNGPSSPETSFDEEECVISDNRPDDDQGRSGSSFQTPRMRRNGAADSAISLLDVMETDAIICRGSLQPV